MPEALDRDDLCAVEAQREGQTGIDPLPVHEHGASAALPTVAALLGSSQVEALAQEVEQRDPRVVEHNCPPLAVKVKAYGEGHEDSRALSSAGTDIEGGSCPRKDGRAAAAAGSR